MNVPSARPAGAGWVYPTPAQPVAPPIYGPAHRPPSGYPTPTPPYAGRPQPLRQPYGPPQPVQQPPTPRRSGLVVGLVAGGVALLAVVVTIAVLVVQLFVGPQTLSSANGVMAVQVPGSWDDLTSVDAGQSYTAADEDDEWVIPDLEAESFDGGAHLSAWVSDSADGPYTSVQKDVVATTCEQEGCLSRGTPTHVIVAGRPAIQQLLRHPSTGSYGSSTSLVVSVTQGATVVSMVIWWDELSDPDTAAILDSVTLTR